MTEYADDVLSCSPTITTDDETACWFPGCHLILNGGLCSFYRVQSSWYWSSSSYVSVPTSARRVNFNDGIVSLVSKDSGLSYIWPVRGGQ